MQEVIIPWNRNPYCKPVHVNNWNVEFKYSYETMRWIIHTKKNLGSIRDINALELATPQQIIYGIGQVFRHGQVSAGLGKLALLVVGKSGSRWLKTVAETDIAKALATMLTNDGEPPDYLEIISKG